MAKSKPLKQIQASTIDGGSVNLYYQDTPDECPRCHVRLVPRMVSGMFSGLANQTGSKLQVAYQCTNLSCQEAFFGNYEHSYDSNVANHVYQLVGTSPKSPKPAEFSNSINDVSPTFVTVYNQAIAAESAGLDQISGIGLRKSVEVLVKDFLIHEDPNNAETIKTTALGACIANHVADANIKACAARATWLGNDEAHYVRKWVERDITDLKTLIRLTVNWIDNVILTQQYMKDMDPTKPSSESSGESPTELTVSPA
jgi:hypothetical protein